MSASLKERIYYAQNKEDLILDAFFPDVLKGFYVDIGANDPTVDSATKLFYEKGWRGINIEPISRLHTALVVQRPHDINLNIGIGEKNGKLSFTEYTSRDGLSTFSERMVDEYKGADKEVFNDMKQYDVPVRALRDVLKENNATKIHFMKIDVEGFEYEVLSGNDWKAFRPEVICIEANHIVKDWRPLLLNNKYELAFFDGLNEYYVDVHTNRHLVFDFVNSVIINKGGGIRFSDYEIIVRQDEAIREAHLRLQAALKAKADQNDLYQKLLAENHLNHTKAVVAERALRRPTSFTKYQLKRGHRLALKTLKTKPAPEYLKEERKSKDVAINELKAAKNDKQLLNAVKKISAIETSRLERVHRTNSQQSRTLKTYVSLVNGVKRLRVKGIVR